MDASERDALLDCERSYHGEDHLVSNPPASSSSSSSSFASRITTKSLVAGVAGMVLCAYSGHTVKRMLGAGQRGDAVRVFSFSIFFFFFFGCRGFLMFRVKRETRARFVFSAFPRRRRVRDKTHKKETVVKEGWGTLRALLFVLLFVRSSFYAR